MPMIIQWNALCIGLTNRVIRLLYGPDEGSETVIINVYVEYTIIYHLYYIYIKTINHWSTYLPLIISQCRDGISVRIILDDEYTYYAWYRFLRILCSSRYQ